MKSLPYEEYQGNVQPIRSRNAASFGYGARDTATSVVLRTCSCRSLPIPSAAEEQLEQPSSQSGPNMKWCITSCGRPSNRSSRLTVPSGPSNVYGLSMRTIGSRRRSALTRSRARVSSFSFASSSLRAASHSSRDTTSGRFPSRHLVLQRVDVDAARCDAARLEPVGETAQGHHGQPAHRVAALPRRALGRRGRLGRADSTWCLVACRP